MVERESKVSENYSDYYNTLNGCSVDIHTYLIRLIGNNYR